MSPFAGKRVLVPNLLQNHRTIAAVPGAADHLVLGRGQTVKKKTRQNAGHETHWPTMIETLGKTLKKGGDDCHESKKKRREERKGEKLKKGTIEHKRQREDFDTTYIDSHDTNFLLSVRKVAVKGKKKGRDIGTSAIGGRKLTPIGRERGRRPCLQKQSMSAPKHRRGRYRTEKSRLALFLKSRMPK